ncbi:ParB N-terminal domain-containing protein [Gammaproteobacteria bacterium]|nr:ParB N-terminal domain-containing protein [Gammaproteobacteria bacterium]
MIRNIVNVNVDQLKHIEDFGRKRVDWLKNKILSEGVWTVPLKIEKKNFLVMDGQHRMEVAKLLNLKYVPCILYSYDEVKVWSLRDNYEVNADLITQRVFEDNIYPYKTAKHAFPDSGDLKCEIPLSQLKKEISSI